jgi:hypothetical protein
MKDSGSGSERGLEVLKASFPSSSISSTFAPLLQPLFEGLILLVAVSIGALGMLLVRNALELYR